MRQLLLHGMLWFSAVGCGLLAGVYFAFSAFVMSALSRIDYSAAISAMNAINVVIVRSLFMPLFLGTTLTSAALAVMALLRWSEPGSGLLIAGGIVYVVGMAVVTMVFNVPLNDALANVGPGEPGAAALWEHYLKDWTLWNHVRTATSLGACVLYVYSLASK